MATIQKTIAGTWRAIIRRKGVATSRTFQRKVDAVAWAQEIELGIHRGQSPRLISKRRSVTVVELIDQHCEDLREVGRAPRRSKDYCLKKLKERLGHVKVENLTREFLINFGKQRAKSGAGPVTVGMDFTYLKTVSEHAVAIHGIAINTEPIKHARIALRRLGLIGKSKERDRRPSKDELVRLYNYFYTNDRQKIPVSRLMKFAIATGMREEEICRISWSDFDRSGGIIVVRQRKDPRKKNDNDQRVPLVKLTGYDPIALIFEELGARDPVGRIFPYNSKSLGTAFTRACQKLGIEDLHFHDMRHEATSRLFEAGLDIPAVASITGHKDWKMLQRYTHLKPQEVVERARQLCG